MMTYSKQHHPTTSQIICVYPPPFSKWFYHLQLRGCSLVMSPVKCQCAVCSWCTLTFLILCICSSNILYKTECAHAPWLHRSNYYLVQEEINKLPHNAYQSNAYMGLPDKYERAPDHPEKEAYILASKVFS